MSGSSDDDNSLEIFDGADSASKMLGPYIPTERRMIIAQILEKMASAHREQKSNKVNLIMNWRLIRLNEKVKLLKDHSLGYEVLSKIIDRRRCSFYKIKEFSSVKRERFTSTNLVNQITLESTNKTDELKRSLEKYQLENESLRKQLEEARLMIAQNAVEMKRLLEEKSKIVTVTEQIMMPAEKQIIEVIKEVHHHDVEREEILKVMEVSRKSKVNVEEYTSQISQLQNQVQVLTQEKDDLMRQLAQKNSAASTDQIMEQQEMTESVTQVRRKAKAQVQAQAVETEMIDESTQTEMELTTMTRRIKKKVNRTKEEGDEQTDQ